VFVVWLARWNTRRYWYTYDTNVATSATRIGTEHPGHRDLLGQFRNVHKVLLYEGRFLAGLACYTDTTSSKEAFASTFLASFQFHLRIAGTVLEADQTSQGDGNMSTDEMRPLSEAVSVLNISILRNTRDKKLWISQHGYIEKICTKFGIEDTGRTATTPLLSSYRPRQYEGQPTLHQITEMQEKVGSILYAANVSRSDMSFAASQSSQFTLMEKNSEEIWKQVNQWLKENE
jgi:hypothetical protein